MWTNFFLTLFPIIAARGVSIPLENGIYESIAQSVSCCQCTSSQFNTCLRNSSVNSPVILRIINEVNNKKFHDAVGRMETMSRIMAIIVIQKHLYDGIISKEAFGPNILGFKSVNSSQIENLIGDDLKNWLREIGRLPEKFPEGFKEIEKKFEVLENFRVMFDKLPSYTTWLHDTPFESSIKSIADNGLDLKLLDAILKESKTWQVELELVKSISVELGALGNSSNFQVANAYITNLKNTMNNLSVAINRLSAADGKDWKYLHFESAIGAVSEVEDLIKVVERADELVEVMKRNGTEEAEFQNALTYFKGIWNLANSSHRVEDNVWTMERMVERSYYTSYPRFANGYSDISLAFSELREDDWVRRVMRSQRFDDSLYPVTLLVDNLKNIDDKLTKIKNEKVSDFKSFVGFFDRMRRIVDQYPGTDPTAAERMWECKTHFWTIRKVDSKRVEQLIRNDARELDEKMLKVSSDVQKIVDIFEKASASGLLTDVMEMSRTSSDNSTVTRESLSWLKSSEKVGKIGKLLVEMEEAYHKIEIPKQLAESMADRVGDIEKYFESLASYRELFHCLKYFGNADTKSVTNMFNAMSFSGLSPPFDHLNVTRGAEVVKEIIRMKYDVSSLEAGIHWARTARGSDQEAWKTLPDVAAEAKSFAQATKIIVGMRNVMENRSIVSPIFEYEAFLRSRLALSNLSAYEEMCVREVIQLTTTIPKNFQRIEEWKMSASSEKAMISTSLSDYADVFFAARPDTTFTVTLSAMATCVDALASLATDPVDEYRLMVVKSALETMDVVGVDLFSDWLLKWVKGNLEAFDAFFSAHLRATEPKAKPAIVPKGDPGAVEANVTSSTTTTIAPFYANLPYGGIAVGVVGFCAFIGIILCCVIGRKKKKEKTETSKVDSENSEVDSEVDSENEGSESASSLHYLSKSTGAKFEQDLYRKLKFAEKQSSGSSPQEPCFKVLCALIFGAVDLDTMLFGTMDLVNKHKKETRRLIPLHPETRVKLLDFEERFKNDYIHASIVTLPNGREMILTQGPQRKTIGVMSTVEKFWWMVKTAGAEFIVMLCRLTEDGIRNCDDYFPDDEGDTCDFRNLKLSCKSKSTGHYGFLITREIVVAFVGEPEFTITQLHYIGWPQYTAPQDPGVVCEMLSIVRKSSKPVIVHCSNGVGRSGAFAYIELGIQTLRETGSLQFGAALYQLRAMRAQAVQRPIQLAFAKITIARIATFHGESKYDAIKALYTQYLVAEDLERPTRSDSLVVSLPSSSEESSTYSEESETEFGKPVVQKKVAKKRRGRFLC